MQDNIRPYSKDSFEYETRPKKIKVSVTVSSRSEEIMYALTRFNKHSSVSAIVDLALSHYFEDANVAKEIAESYENWEIAWKKRKQKKGQKCLTKRSR